MKKRIRKVDETINIKKGNNNWARDGNHLQVISKN